jgi:hypothetical protein
MHMSRLAATRQRLASRPASVVHELAPIRTTVQLHDCTTRLTTSLDLSAGRGQLDEDDVTESLLRVVGDTDGADVGGLVVGDPLVVLRVAGCR